MDPRHNITAVRLSKTTFTTLVREPKSRSYKSMTVELPG